MAISRHFYRRRLTASKYAVIVSYNGSGYSGLQWQSDLRIPTIEGVIWEAFYAAGLIRKSSTRNNCHALQFSRASRTDRGVSALGQVLSCVLNKYTPEKLPLINAHLPDHIRVHDVIDTVQSFDAWDWANHRHYSYIVPTYAFADVTDCLPKAHSYRISESHLAYVRKVLSQFLGSRNYLNFTDPYHIRKYYQGRKQFLSACHRVIFGASLEDPFVYRGVEFCVLNFKGTSFLLHQIRKMVSTTIAVSRGIITFEDFNRFFKYTASIPLAPGFPLFLQSISFQQYNREQCLLQDPNNGSRHEDRGQKLELSPQVMQEVELFKRQKVFVPILDHEVCTNEMGLFCSGTIADYSRIVSEVNDYKSWANEIYFEPPRYCAMYC